jgi:hypothetical protein
VCHSNSNNIKEVISKECTIYANYNAIKCICAWDIVAVVDSLIAGFCKNPKVIYHFITVTECCFSAEKCAIQIPTT